ncbi:MAG: S9 family peptidase [Candidatus Acidiferrum sp.]|jgi:dipeptidyl-peptidase-4
MIVSGELCAALRLKTRNPGGRLAVALILALAALGAPRSRAQQNAASPPPAGALSVDRIYSAPSLSGQLARGLEWSPDGKLLSFFETRGQGKEARTELWSTDATTGERRLLIAADKLLDILPPPPARANQSTGLGRIAPSQYQWAPGSAALLFQGEQSLTWFDLGTQTPRALVSGTETLADPKVSPDGRSVSFVRQHNVWIVDVASGKERAVTHGGTEEMRKGELDWVYPEELEIKTAYWWAPDSSAIAYLEMNESQVTQYPLVDFASYSGDADMERYPIAGGKNPVVRVLVALLKGGEPQVMDTGENSDIYLARVDWLRDARHLAIQRLNRAQTEIDLLIADAATGKTRVALHETDSYWINLSDDLYFLADGKRFVWSSERSGYRHLYLYDLDGKQLAQLTKGAWEETGVEGVDESRALVYFSATEKSVLERHLYRVALDGSGFARITKEDGTHRAVMNEAADKFVDTYSNVMTPPREDLYAVNGSRIATLRENKVAELANYRLSPVEFLSVPTHDGIKLNAMMIKPPNFDPAKHYPVLFYTYGGPHVQIVVSAWGGANFLWHQMMAEKGFIIFALDNRGSAGRGHLFEEFIHFKLGAQELSDQRDGAAYLRTLPYVDGQRMGIWGASYGGHMTLHAMFEDPEDFKAGFAGAPVTDWHYYDSIYTERYLGLLPQNEESYQESSPIENVAKLRGKLLVAHGTGDDNVHFANTLALLNDAIAAGKTIEVMPFPGLGHGINDPNARRLMMQRVTRFFLDNL